MAKAAPRRASALLLRSKSHEGQTQAQLPGLSSTSCTEGCWSHSQHTCTAQGPALSCSSSKLQLPWLEIVPYTGCREETRSISNISLASDHTLEKDPKLEDDTQPGLTGPSEIQLCCCCCAAPGSPAHPLMCRAQLGSAPPTHTGLFLSSTCQFHWLWEFVCVG